MNGPQKPQKSKRYLTWSANLGVACVPLYFTVNFIKVASGSSGLRGGVAAFILIILGYFFVIVRAPSMVRWICLCVVAVILIISNVVPASTHHINLVAAAVGSLLFCVPIVVMRLRTPKPTGPKQQVA